MRGAGACPQPPPRATLAGHGCIGERWDPPAPPPAPRSARIGAQVLMCRVIETKDHSQQWLGVADIMRAEAQEQARAVLAQAAARANGVAGITPEQVIREGPKAAEIFKLIDEDEDIAVLVLAAGTAKEGPGPLVSDLSKTAGTFPIPVAIVPGHLTDEELDAMS